MAKLHRVTIDGKSGTIAYLDANGALTTPDKAVTAKVVFDDGSRVFLTPGGQP